MTTVLVTYVLALLFGVVAGLRTFTAPAAASWAVHLGWLNPGGSPLGFLGNSSGNAAGGANFGHVLSIGREDRSRMVADGAYHRFERAIFLFA